MFSFYGMSQTLAKPDMNGVNIAKPYTKQLIAGYENGGAAVKGPGGNQTATSNNGVVIGTTTYDLQTNASVQNRLVRHADGTLSAVWTYSNTYTLAAPDRGTGYNYFNGTSWGTAPTSRIETERGGWPSIVGVLGGEVNTLHNTTSSVITMNRRSLKGTGSWTETNVTNPSFDILWNRTAVGGPNGTTLHMIGVTAPVANGGQLFQGLDGALLYWRSNDGGVTWDIANTILPGMTANFFVGFDGDSYAITAKGNTVVIAVFNDWADSFIMKSTDNGNTWTKKIFLDFPIDMYVTDQTGGSDVDGDGVADTIMTTDNSGSVVIDNNGKVHVFFGSMRVLDADLTDGFTTYFPYTNGLLYWNEDMDAGEAQYIAWAEDFDGDGVAINSNETDIARYYTSLSSFPSAVFDDATGTIYLTYSAYMENLDNGAQSYRHVYMIYSDDNGCSWSDFTDVTPNNNFAECVFASLASTVGDSIRFIYQEDVEPGLAVRGDNDAFDLNEIVYVAVHKSELASNMLNCVTWVKGPREFCSGDTVTLEASCGTAYSWSNGSNAPTTDIVTHGTYTVDITTSCGTVQTQSVTLTAPTTPPTLIPTGTPSVCGSNPTTIGVQPVSLGQYLWSTGDTTPSITVTAAGTYTVTVTNCGGTDSLTINVTVEPTPSNTVNTIGLTEFCEGSGSLTLSALEGASWLWSNGDTTQSITLTNSSESGTYTCQISNSCGVSVTSNPITVTIHPKPATPVITYLGNGIYQSSATSGNQWYVDGNPVPGATGTTFDASKQAYAGKTITVKVTDNNGCSSDFSDAVVSVEDVAILIDNITLFPNPNRGVFYINFDNAEAGIYTLRLNTLTGQQLFSRQVAVAGVHSELIDVTSLSKGVYFLTITLDNAKNTYRIVIE